MPSSKKPRSKLKNIFSEAHKAGAKHAKEWQDFIDNPGNKERHDAYNEAMEFMDQPNFPDETYIISFYIMGAIGGAYRSIRKLL